MFGTRNRLLRRAVKERFVVSPKDGPTFVAILVDVDAVSYHFANVSVLGEGVERPAAGEVYIDRANVAYLQRTMPTVG